MNRSATKSDKKELRKENPVLTAGFFSKITFWWLKDFFRLGLKGPIDGNDIYVTKDDLGSEKLTNLFIKLWDNELQNKDPSILKLVFRQYGGPILFFGILFSIVETVMRFMQPLCLGGLVSYFVPGQTDISKQDAYLYAGGIVLSSGVQIITFHPFILYIFEVSAQIRLGCAGLIYRKLLKLSKAAVYEGLNGKVINILSNDLTKFDMAFCFLHDTWKGPMEAILAGYFIYREIELASIIGLAFLLSFIPIQAWIGKKAAQLRLRTAKRTDYRVRIMNEIILGIQVIKMYAWEKSFAIMVAKIRKKEMNAIRGSAYIRATLFSFGMISRLSIFLSLISYIYFGNTITARKVFIVSSFYNILNLSMVYFWPVALTTVAEGYISAKRVQEFLLASEDKPNYLTNGDSKDINKKFQRKNLVNEVKCVPVVRNGSVEKLNKPVENVTISKGIRMKNVTALWQLSEKPKGINAIDLEVIEGEHCAVVGQVGSGKTTLLNTLIGELAVDRGELQINGTISYAAQEPWLFEGTIKDNIVFVEEFDQKRYNDVIRVCALQSDLKSLPNNDLTIVGERGISLSGGQKARVNLARAVYKQADIYLLDDPLSAVDTHVGKHIFQECICSYLKTKICILVTHQLQYLKEVEHLVLLEEGNIVAQGTYAEIREKTDESFWQIESTDSSEKTELAEKQRERQRSSSSISSIISDGFEDEIDEKKEQQAIGAVKLKDYAAYFKSVDSSFYIILILIFFILAQFGQSGIDYFVAQWANWEESINAVKIKNETDFIETDATNPENEAIRKQYIINYSIAMAIVSYIYIQRTFGFFKMCLRASIKLHDKLFQGITRANMYFFNNNPSGRILNRFSKDINNVDSTLPPALIDCTTFFLELIAISILVAIVNYWLLIPTAFMTLLFYILRTIYISAARSIKRIESLTLSPVYSHTNATLQGLSTIRAFRANSILEKEFLDYQDINTGSWYLRITTTRAFALWLDLVCLFYIAFVTFSFLIFSSENAKSGNIGLAILQCINLVGMCQWGMRQTAELENQMTSVERILEYANLPSETSLESENKYRPPHDWPAEGQITINDLNFKYSENIDYVLKNINVQIKAKEKIGIVGRTGAGKSSIIQSLFRLACNDGVILIDGLDINNLGLHDLRKKISIIPQDPVLFSGTMRFNLDPFDEKKDDELWSALEQVELKSNISQMVGGLDCKMADGGSNFSMGQRQLVCLARAILRNNKVLILDEATANVDPETDKLIQNTIRQNFANCTVLTIAHRLHTVMDNDRILVIDDGRVVEFGHPYDLLQRSDGFLRQFVDKTGGATASTLVQIAAQSYSLIKKEKKQ